MEPLEIFDSINNKYINVYVTTEVAEKCRTDNVFAQDLFNKLQDQNIQEGSAVEIDTIKTEAAEESIDTFEEPIEAVDESISEEKSDKETWCRRDTLKLIKVYQKNKPKFHKYGQKKLVWNMIAKELSLLNVHKSPEKCAEKWKNLLRTFRTTNEKPFVPTRFQYYQEMKDVFNNTQVTVSDTDSDDLDQKQKRTASTERSFSPLDQDLRDEPVEKEFWSRYETLKLLKAYQKHKELRKSCAKDRQFWMVISAELAKDNIQKPLDKCATKWKNLFRSYKRNVNKPTLPSRFQYFSEVDDVMNNVELYIPDNIINIPDDVDFEKILDPEQFKCFLEESDFENGPKDICSWTAEETLKLIRAYKKHKHRFKKSATKKYVWAIIAAELTEEGVQRDTEKCENKWKSLMRSYKKGVKSGESPRFYFYDEMCEVLKDDDSLYDGEVSTTQNEISFVCDRESLSNTASPDNTEVLENEDNEAENSYEQIIIETEPEKPDETDDNRYWSYNETTGLLNVYAKHRDQFKQAKKKTQVWEEISQELESLNIYKSPESCEKKWKNLFTVYKTHKLNRTGPGKFNFYKEIDDMLREKPEASINDDSVVHNKKCKCIERRMLEKQKRHIERMQLLKRKLDLEERKVEAFEFYVKHLKNRSS